MLITLELGLKPTIRNIPSGEVGEIGGGGGVGEGEGEQDEGVGGDETNFRISLSGGRTVFAHKIVVAPGAYLNLSNILKVGGILGKL